MAFLIFAAGLIFTSCGGSSTPADGSSVFTVTYDANGGTGTVPADSTSYSPTFTVTVLANVDLVKTGFTFAGWNTSADGNGTDRAAGSTFEMGSANVILYAKWTTQATYTITYNANTGSGDVPTDSNNYTSGSQVTVLANVSLTKSGCTFIGWNTQADGNGTARAAGSSFSIGAANVILYATWAADTIPTYTVTYNANEGTGDVPADSNNYLAGATVTVLGNVNLVNEGYSFGGWNTQADGEGTDKAAGSTFAIGSENLTLYAKWTMIVPGKNWINTSANFPARECHTTVEYDGKIWVIGGVSNWGENNGNKNDVWSSSDKGATWTLVTANAEFSARNVHTSVVFGGKMWVIGGYGYDANGDTDDNLSDVWSSSDGKTWTLVTSSAAFGARSGHTSVIFGGKMWVIGGITTGSENDIWCNDVWSSTDGITWTMVKDNDATDAAVGSFPRRMGHSTTVFTTDETEKMWITGGMGTNDNVNSASRFNDVWSSIDGITWTKVLANNSGSQFTPRMSQTFVSTVDKMWLIGGDDYDQVRSDVWSSTNGVDWVYEAESAFMERDGHTSIVLGDKILVIGGEGYDYGIGDKIDINDVWSSDDGVIWTQSIFSKRINFSSVVFNGKMWVIGGYDSFNDENLNDVWSSPDGITWTNVKPNDPEAAGSFLARSGHTTVVFTVDGTEKMFIIGGYDYNYEGIELNDVWSSEDGINWTEESVNTDFPFTARVGHTSVVFDEKMWVIGGYDDNGYFNGVWSSSNGIDWFEESPENESPFSARWGHTSLVFNDKIWIIGGDGGDGYVNDVWSSEDGINWITVKANDSENYEFSSRYFHSSVVYDNKMWVISGDGDGYLNDVWFSEDGSTWTAATEDASFSRRFDQKSVVFNSRMWVIGGVTGNGEYLQDVWSAE